VATGFAAGTYTTVSSLVDLYTKTNTDVKQAIKARYKETGWLRSYPKEMVKYSPNETRIPLILTKPTGVAMIPDGGYEATPNTNAPTSGTISMVQMNARFSYTGLADALDGRSRSTMIEQQTAYQSFQKGVAIGRTIAYQTYGQSTGGVAVVKTTGSASATQNGVALKNAFQSTLVAGGTTPQDTYLSNLFIVGEHIALIRSGAIVEFGTVVASPSVGSGVGFADFLFNSSITPTANDVIVLANAITDSTITGTDTNRWPIGFIEALTASSVHGVTTSAYPYWAAGSTQTTTQRLSFQVKEKMMNDIFNASGMTMDRMIVSDGIRRDAIAGERGARRYDSAEMDLEGELGKFKYLHSEISPPGLAIGWYSQAYSKLDLTDQPEDEMTKGGFKLDKVQDRSAWQGSFDYFYTKVVSARSAMGYASNLQES
jgi:hypothetical protein